MTMSLSRDLIPIRFNLFLIYSISHTRFDSNFPFFIVFLYMFLQWSLIETHHVFTFTTQNESETDEKK